MSKPASTSILTTLDKTLQLINTTFQQDCYNINCVLHRKADESQASSKNMTDNTNFFTYTVIQITVIFC